MNAVRELTTDELTAVCGGMTNSNNGSLPYPKPFPWDVLVKWVLGQFK